MTKPDPHALATALESAAAKLREQDSINWTQIIQTLLPLLIQLIEAWISPSAPPAAIPSRVEESDAPELD